MRYPLIDAFSVVMLELRCTVCQAVEYPFFLAERKACRTFCKNASGHLKQKKRLTCMKVCLVTTRSFTARS